MPLTKRPFIADEELGKKDDDHRPKPDRWRASRMAHWKTPRPRRLLLAIVCIYLIYLFFKNMPTDLVPAEERFNPALAQARQRDRTLKESPLVPTSAIPLQEGSSLDEVRIEDKGDKEEGLYYEGPIKFYALGQSLRRSKKPSNPHDASHAVVFAGSNLKSVSDLIPLACEMARRKMNKVHFVLMGRDDVSIAGIQQVNGISDDNCPVIWHDSRPDYGQVSTESRMERAVMAGLAHVRSYLHPQVIITQAESWEDNFFCNGARKKIQETGISHIVLPSAARDLMWMSTLDSNALQVWNDVHIEILIHAPSESSGSLIRLIKSLEMADYLGSMPSLTIELPHEVDQQLLSFLQNMKWPHHSSGKVTLRRRVQPHDMTSMESSIRIVEAFYPRDPSVSHVLVLSPQTELAPSFFHYLKYAVLNYKQSARAKRASSKLLGISLELPSSNPTDDEPFRPPLTDSGKSTEQNARKTLPLFLWQAPNSNAALYFGDKWAEFHSFLSNRLAVQEANRGTPAYEKLMSKKYSAFMEYLLELTRARGYYMLYPSFPIKGTFSLATVHNELYHPPEEFAHDGSSATLEPDIDLDEPSMPLTAESIEELGSIEKPLNRASTVMGLLDRFSMAFPEIDSLDLLSYSGEKLSDTGYREEIANYTKKFRSSYGGCRDGSIGTSVDVSKSEDLFCLSD